jgi:hypothetical protein
MIQRIHMRDARGPMILISLRLESARHFRVILSAAKDLIERSDTGREAGVRSL